MSSKENNFVSRRKGWLYTTLGYAVVSVFIVVAIEAFVRVAIDDGMQYDLEMWKYARSLKKISENLKIGHEHAPGTTAHLMGTAVTINEDGLRDAPVQMNADKKRVLMLGDSLMFGWGVAQDKTTSALLEKKLNARGIDTDVINTGVGNYNTVMQVEYFFERGIKYRPDVIVLNYFINDAEPVPAYDDVGGFLNRNSYAWVFFGSRIDSLLRQVQGRKDWKDYYHDLYKAPSWAEAKAAISKLADYAKSKDIPLIVANYPELRILDPYPFDDVRKAISEIVQQEGALGLDLYSSVKDVDPQTLWVTRPDPHPNANASTYYSDALLPMVECTLKKGDCRELTVD